jgi:hypothetical protein
MTRITVSITTLAAMFVGFTSSASAVTPAILIGPDLKPREVKLQSLGGGKMTFFDAERTMQIEPTGKVLQVRFPQPRDEAVLLDGNEAPASELTPVKDSVKPPGAAPPVAPVGSPTAKPSEAFLELIDGQRIVGKFLGSDAEGQKLRFQHATLGEVTVELDRISRLAFDGRAAARATPVSDLVVLANGDETSGFVAAIKDTEIVVQQTNATPLTLPRDRVRALYLANPVVREAGKQHMAWLRDGSRLLATEVAIAEDKLTITSPITAKPVTLALSAVARVELASLEGRLIDVADLPMKVTAGGKVFGLAMMPRIEGDAIRMHAPVTVEFELPEKAVRFAALAELDAEGEDAMAAEFIVSVRTTGQAAASAAITARHPQAVMNAAITGKTLTLTLDPASNGPVMDRLRLRDAVIFVESR